MENNDPLESFRFLKGKNIVRDLCLREKDFIQKNRLWYMTFLRDAYILLNIRTVMLTKRVALPVQEGFPFIYTPADYLELSSISAPDKHNKLTPMIINTDIKSDIADLALDKHCGCGCGCDHDYCASIRNFETIYGTMDAVMPDATTKTFTTSYRKILLRGGNLVEESIVPEQIFVDNIHVETVLQKNVTILCQLDIKEKCGCIKHTEENRRHIENFCTATDVHFECGCSVKNTRQSEKYNVDEQGDKIYLPSNFRQSHVVLRYFSNSKTKDLVVPFLAKEALMSGIKKLATKYDPAASKSDKAFWANEHNSDMITFVENLNPIKITSFLNSVLAHNPEYREIHHLPHANR